MTAFSLRHLEADLQKVITEITAEIDQDDGDTKGMYVWRDSTGEKSYWSPNPHRYVFQDVATLAEADHIMFLCPECFAKNGGAVGTHRVMVTFTGRNVPDEAGTRDSNGQPSRWNVSGTSLDDLVLTPSIQLNASAPPESKICRWHGFVGSSGIPPGHAG